MRGVERLLAESPRQIDTLLCFGFGAGHFLFHLKKVKHPFRRVICYEPPGGSLELAEIKQKKRTLEANYSKKGVELEITNQLKFPVPISYAIYSIPYYQRHYSTYWQQLKKYLQKDRSINESSKKEFSQQWFQRFYTNVLRSIEHPACYWLNRDDFQNIKPIVFTGASPILEQQIEVLGKIRHQIWLLASDTSCNFLWSKGIMPDAILSVDSGIGTGYHIRDTLPQKIPIFTRLSGHPKIWQLGNPVVLLFTTFPMDQLIAGLVGSAPVLENPALNLAGLAVSLAEYLQAENFYTAGIDFLAHNGRTHCRATGYELYQLHKITRWSSLVSYMPITYRQNKISAKNQLAIEYLRKKNVLSIDQFQPSSKQKTSWTPSAPVTGSFVRQMNAIIHRYDIQKEVMAELDLSVEQWQKMLLSWQNFL